MDARQISTRMLGHRLHTKQTSADGLVVDRIFVTEQIKYDIEYYLTITVDRESYAPAIVLSKQGGINIESAAQANPDAILRIPLDYKQGVTEKTVAQIAQRLGLSAKPSGRLSALLRNLYSLFTSSDATLLEINPLVRTAEDDFLCLGSKFIFDNAAAPRQPDIFALRDGEQDSPSEGEAEKHGLVYVRLESDIGNVVNGAGLAMATNDAISFYGGKSANFLDAGGQATTETMVKAFEIILKDDRVKDILVNIYGGKSGLNFLYGCLLTGNQALSGATWWLNRSFKQLLGWAPFDARSL